MMRQRGFGVAVVAVVAASACLVLSCLACVRVCTGDDCDFHPTMALLLLPRYSPLSGCGSHDPTQPPMKKLHTRPHGRMCTANRTGSAASVVGVEFRAVQKFGGCGGSEVVGKSNYMSRGRQAWRLAGKKAASLHGQRCLLPHSLVLLALFHPPSC